jgi:hypothetical protein
MQNTVASSAGDTARRQNKFMKEEIGFRAEDLRVMPGVVFKEYGHINAFTDRTSIADLTA